MEIIMDFQFIHQGNIFDSGCMALVNPVNCQGVMGKGLAKEFKKRFPHNFKVYKIGCSSGYVRTGKVFPCSDNQQIIINFPTKDDWRKPSEYEYIEKGLKDLVETLKDLPFITSIAIPPLGCGLGGLDWDKVLALIETELLYGLGSSYPLNVKVYCP
jgi:O-acetyl-ADP-ribose deacetylase (regulator of RNase III)